MRKAIAATVLMLVLVGSAYAGEMQCGLTDPPPPPSLASQVTDTTIETMLVGLISLLPRF
jgi:hypothetical protein